MNVVCMCVVVHGTFNFVIVHYNFKTFKQQIFWRTLKFQNLINIIKQTNPLQLRRNVDEPEHVFSVTKLPLLTAAAYLSVNPAAKLIHLFYLLPSQMIYVAF